MTGVFPATQNSGSYSEIDCLNHSLEIRYIKRIHFCFMHHLTFYALFYCIGSLSNFIGKGMAFCKCCLYCQKIIFKFSDYYFGWEGLLFCLCLPFPRVPSLHSLFPAERKVHFPLCSGERGNHHGLDFSLFHTYNPGAGIGAMGIAIVYLKAHKKLALIMKREKRTGLWDSGTAQNFGVGLFAILTNEQKPGKSF